MRSWIQSSAVMNCSRALLGSMALSVAAGPSGAGEILFVDDDAPPGGDGATWNTAFRFLQDALTAARERGGEIEEIRIADGTYFPDRSEAHPDGTGDRAASFELVSGIEYVSMSVVSLDSASRPHPVNLRSNRQLFSPATSRKMTSQGMESGSIGMTIRIAYLRE